MRRDKVGQRTDMTEMAQWTAETGIPSEPWPEAGVTLVPQRISSERCARETVQNSTTKGLSMNYCVAASSLKGSALSAMHGPEGTLI